MKNFIKIVTLAVISIFIAVSCAPPVELSDFDWDAANADRSSAGNGGYNVSQYVPAYSATEIENADKTVITDLEIEITFKPDADVLRKEITASSLSFLTFHTFEKSEEKYTADTLSAPLPFTVEQRNGDVITVKVPVNITKSSTYRNIIARIDGKKYTYAHGIRLDVDSNGKIENVYDDYYYSSILVAGASSTLFTAPGQKTTSVSLLGFSPTISTVPTAPSTPSPEYFYFVDAAATTTSNLLLVAQLWYDSEFDKDVGGVIAGGIKLQKLNGTTWTDVKSAEFDETRRNSSGAESATGDYNFIVIKDVTFDHLGTYRIFWKGKAYTETTGTYYGVKQRISVKLVSDSVSGAARYTRTEIATTTRTVVNSKVKDFGVVSVISSSTREVVSWDSENKNVVLKIELPDGYYWKNTPAPADFKKSFKVVYSNSGSNVDNAASDLIYVDVKNVEFKAEDNAIAGGTEKGKNVLYITLDPNFVFDVDAYGIYQNWLNTIYYPWQQSVDDYQEYQNDFWQYDNVDMPQYNAAKSAWDDAVTAYEPYAEWLEDCEAYEEGGGTVGDGNTGDPGDWDGEVPQNPGPEPVEPTEPVDPGAPGSEPQYPDSKGTALYFRINDNISVTDNGATENVYYFGSASPFYDNFDFYGPVF
jgi:hypothetical protein